MSITTTRTYSVTDACGNAINVSQNIIRNVDTTPPTASNPSAINLLCNGIVPAPDPAVVVDEADNCTGAITVSFVNDVVNLANCTETTTRTYSVTDACGNAINVSQNIIRNVDTTPPTVDATAMTNIVACGNVPLPVNPPANDNCTGAIIYSSVDVVGAISTCEPYNITRNWTLRDECGNVNNSFVQTITIYPFLNITATINDGACSGTAEILCNGNILASAVATGVPAPANCSPQKGFATTQNATYIYAPGTPCEATYTATATATGCLGPSNCVTPVELISFTGKAVNQVNILRWVTASEVNNDKFAVERSTDGINFEIIGWVKGNGTTTQTHYYEFVDENPMKGSNYYRLNQFDFNGVNEYSKVILLESDNTKHLRIANLYPNPTAAGVNYSVFALYETNGSVAVIDMLGQVVYTSHLHFDLGDNLLYFDASNLNAGAYMLMIKDDEDNKLAQKRFVKIDR